MALAMVGWMGILWALGGYFRWPRPLVWGLIVVSYLAGLGLQMTVPQGEPGGWALFGGLAALAGLYAFGLARLKARMVPQPDPAPRPTGLFRDAELERYTRHIVLRELGGPGQRKLKEAKVLVVGAGGLGSPALLYLAAAGVGTLGVIDADRVDNSNLQRQIIHRDGTIGLPKVQSAAEALRALNPFVAVRPYERALTEEMAGELFAQYDVILDGTDNFATRYLSNSAAVAQGKPLISGALAQWEGQISVFDPAEGGPCYECIFPEAPAPGLAPSCAEAGVVAALPGVIGSMMALEAIKQITGAGHVTRGEMLIYDGLYGESRKIKLSPRAGCAVCGALENR
ncbi:molybdopterin-synthase adenylyltransferase MoeB [uncultured Lentibacter sp.]|jgi:molybdopterin/thiamine biosynthesis adenylyltransferase|uniref:HesA/MoeB/ThiF family protein n=1 Tax=uncultured Lentibacter sp. TaxID=1659309 RepID=UPI0026247B85|nr:molybdopterin-synthase adenylyltransferase MoeB [uncultured Lentibacter sp.]